jgi:superfamily I DNA/RNA helicase
MNEGDQKPLTSLNQEQRNAVECTEGPLLVLAGAGTGKTKVITTRIAYLLKRGVAPERILALTFTRKAAIEMRVRIEELVGRKPWGLTVSTFHSLGFRMLREMNRGAPLVVLADKEQLALVQELTNRPGNYLDPERTLNQISRAKNWGLTPDDIARNGEDYGGSDFAACYRDYEAALRSKGAIDLDDMVGRPLKLLQDSDDARAKYQWRFRYILVDEYQDTNRVQYQLTRAILGQANNLCVVGDDDQSIYGFRGAEPQRILSFKDDFPNTTVVALTMNYRSHAEIITLANAIISRAPKRYPKNLQPQLGPGGKIAWRSVGSEEAEAAYITEQIRALIDTGEFSFGEIAVISRLTKDAQIIYDSLKAKKLPCAMGKVNGEENAVSVMTLHQSKGLEFPVVFIPALEDDTLPHYHALSGGPETMEEERRLLYVAVTRAKKRLFMSASSSRKGYSRSISRFIRELPRESLVLGAA